MLEKNQELLQMCESTPDYPQHIFQSLQNYIYPHIHCIFLYFVLLCCSLFLVVQQEMSGKECTWKCWKESKYFWPKKELIQEDLINR